MATRRDRVTGAAAILGGLLVVVVSAPSPWYGLRAHDSYVFSPAPFSPLWVDRYVVPALTVVTVLALLAGLAGLVARDWRDFGRAGRWGGGAAVVGGGLMAVATPVFFVGVGRPSGTNALLALATLLVGALGAVLVGFGFVGLGYAYRVAGRPRLGSVFFAAIVVPPMLGYLMPPAVKVVVAMMPVGLAWVAVGVELLGRWPRGA
ncbi:MAG: hypothetical protein ABEJ90_05095 [Halobacterium sp.]